MFFAYLYRDGIIAISIYEFRINVNYFSLKQNKFRNSIRKIQIEFFGGVLDFLDFLNIFFSLNSKREKINLGLCLANF